MNLSKKIFIISSSILLAVLFLWGIYALIYKQPATSPSKTEKNNPSENSLADKLNLSTPKPEEIIEPLTDEAVISPVLSSDGQSVKYQLKSTGKTWELNTFSSKKTLLSDITLENLLTSQWSPDAEKVLSEFSTTPGRSRFSLHDYDKDKEVNLHENIISAVWQNNNKIIYTYFDANKGSLNIADPDGLNWTKVTDLTNKNISIAPIPMSGLISFWNKPDAFNETLLQSVSVINNEKKVLVKGFFGVDYLWSPDGSLLLESSLDKKGGSKLNLGVVNSVGENYKSLNIPTLISKCIWSRNSEFIYYAHPTTIPEGSVMPNDYLNGKFTTNDTFWKVNVKTGEKTRLVELDDIKSAYDVTSLFLNLDESMLFFINKIDGKLYRILL